MTEEKPIGKIESLVKITDLKLTKTEEELIKCPETHNWILEFYNLTNGKMSHLSSEYSNRLANYPTCMVASVRKKFGLSTYYTKSAMNPPKDTEYQECFVCDRFAGLFYKLRGFNQADDRKTYTKTLANFRQHIRLIHKDGKVKVKNKR